MQLTKQHCFKPLNDKGAGCELSKKCHSTYPVGYQQGFCGEDGYNLVPGYMHSRSFQEEKLDCVSQESALVILFTENLQKKKRKK